MKRRNVILNGISDAIPLACGMIAVSCAMPGVYSIDFSLIPLVMFCIAAAFLLAFWMDAPRFGIGFGAIFLLIVALICVIRMQEIIDGTIVFADKLYEGFPKELCEGFREILQFDAERLTAAAAAVRKPKTAATLILILIAAVNGLLMTGALTRCKTVLLSLMVPLPMLLICMIRSQVQPPVWTAVLLLIYFGYVLLGNGIRKGDAPEKSAFFLLLAPALLTVGLLLLAIVPPSRFTPVPEEKRKAFFNELFQDIADPFMAMIGSRNPRTVDLDKETAREDDDRKLFDLEVSRSGVYHLRTHSYAAYRNNSWYNADPYSGEWNSMEALGTRQKKGPDTMIQINDSYSDERIVPYAWVRQDESTVVGEAGIRAGGMITYYWDFTRDYLSTDPVTPAEAEVRYYTDYAMRQYVMPDGAEKEALLKIASDAGITASRDTLATARKVASFVCGSGEYVQIPGKTPNGRDFVEYFLTEGHEGYCVHFASATTALLQAMGIPARYTVGYYVRVEADEVGTVKPVTKNEEHAWAEVYVQGLGWIPIESTPQFDDDGVGTTPQKEHQTGQSTPKPAPTPAPPTPGQIREEPVATVVPETPQAVPVPATPQEPEDGGEDGAEPSEKKRVSIWWIVLPLIPLLWVGTGLTMRRIREIRFRNVNVKRSIPDMAQYLSMLQRFGVPKDPDAEDWALEAAFSNHTMQAEHRELIKRVRAAQRSVYANAPIRRFLLRWVLYLI